MESKTLKLNLSVLLMRSDEGWVAQCLEYDLAAQGRSIADVKAAFGRTLTGQVLVDLEHGQEPLSGFSPAPREYWTKFGKAERLRDRQPILFPEDSLPEAYMIQAMADDLRVSA